MQINLWWKTTPLVFLFATQHLLIPTHSSMTPLKRKKQNKQRGANVFFLCFLNKICVDTHQASPFSLPVKLFPNHKVFFYLAKVYFVKNNLFREIENFSLRVSFVGQQILDCKRKQKHVRYTGNFTCTFTKLCFVFLLVVCGWG